MNKIKLAISNIAWDKSKDEVVYEMLKQKNIQGLEIAPTRIFEEKTYEQLIEAQKYSDMLREKYDLNIVSMQSIWYGKTENIFESKSNTEELIKYTKQAINFANAIGCSNLVFGCPKNRNISNFKIDYPKAIEFFREIGKYALDKNVIISVEPNPVIYNTNFLNYTEQAIKFVKEVNIESIKVNYDLGTVIYNKEDLDILKDNIKYINHIHISEPNLELIKNRDLHQRLFDLLKEIRYNKYVSIEMKKNENIESIETIIDYVKNTEK